MPRSRVTELPQRQSPRNQLKLRMSISDSDPPHHRPRTERSPKLTDGRLPRSSQSEPVSQKKLGTRIADLESQLGQAQEELKSLKSQLMSAEAAKKAAQDQLGKKSMKHQTEKHSAPIENKAMNKKESSISYETPDDANIQQETDVFEVPVKKVTVEEPKNESDFPAVQNLSIDELALKTDEIKLLMTKLDEKEKELEVFRKENENLKSELNEKSVKISSAESEIAELTKKMNRAEQEVEESKGSAVQIKEKLEDAEKGKEDLENEMRRLRVQTEQWRKAADAAASLLAGGGVEMNGRRISEIYGTMDKQHYGSMFEHGGYGSYVGSRGLVDDDDVFGSGKRKGSSGMRMLGDLWKKKGQK